MEELEVNNSEFTLAQVRDWVVAHRHLEGRFRFFKVYRPNSLLPAHYIATSLDVDDWFH